MWVSCIAGNSLCHPAPCMDYLKTMVYVYGIAFFPNKKTKHRNTCTLQSLHTFHVLCTVVAHERLLINRAWAKHYLTTLRKKVHSRKYKIELMTISKLAANMMYKLNPSLSWYKYTPRKNIDNFFFYCTNSNHSHIRCGIK